MARLILVRHAMPLVEPGVPSLLWGLTEQAREDCVLLAHHFALPLGGIVYASAERKACETAAVLAFCLGREVVIDDAFGEINRPATWDEDYRALVVRYLEGESLAGWEPREHVVLRFSDAVERARQADAGRDIVVVNHGQALSLYLASLVSMEIVPFWRVLSFPDAWALDFESLELNHVYEAGRAPPDA